MRIAIIMYLAANSKSSHISTETIGLRDGVWVDSPPPPPHLEGKCHIQVKNIDLMAPALYF